MGTSTAGVASCVGERTRGGGARRQEGIPSELEGSLACLSREGVVGERPGDWERTRRGGAIRVP